MQKGEIRGSFCMLNRERKEEQEKSGKYVVGTATQTLEKDENEEETVTILSHNHSFNRIHTADYNKQRHDL